MNESELLSALKQDIETSTGSYWDEVNESRAKALDYYLGEPYGNEVEGRSKFVTTEVQDTVESMLPMVMDPFVSSDRAVFFDPVGPEDEQAAKQQTSYVNHVFHKENEGFTILYEWFKDGLMSKNGIVKYYWDDSECVTTERYTNLTEAELRKLISDDAVDVLEQTTSQTQFGPTYDIKIKRTDKGKVTIVNIAPENFLVSDQWNRMTLTDVPFCGDVSYPMLSELKERGYDTKDLEKYAGHSVDSDFNNLEEDARFRDVGQNHFSEDDSNEATIDPASRKVKLTDCCKRIDYDGDGYAELRRVLLVNESYVLANEEIDAVLYESLSPVPMTHRFIGRSAADQSMPLQLQKSMLTRNIFDNLYLINNQRTAVVEGEVNLADVMDSKPGGIVRMNAPGMATPMPTQPFNGHAFGMLEYLDTVKENRTGITRYNQGMDADSLNKTATGINKIMDAASKRMLLIARLYGESMKRLMLGIHRLLLQNQDKEKVVRLTGNWVPVNPSEWRTRTNMTVDVGLGTEDNEKLVGHLLTMLSLQKEAMVAGSPLVTWDNIFNTLSKLTEAAGLKEPSVYWTDPARVPPQPEQPDPQAQMVQAQLQVAQQQNQVKAQEVQNDYDIDQKELLLKAREIAVKEGELQLKQAQALQQSQDDALDRELDASQAELEAMVATRAQ